MVEEPRARRPAGSPHARVVSTGRYSLESQPAGVETNADARYAHARVRVVGALRDRAFATDKRGLPASILLAKAEGLAQGSTIPGESS
jgi:hypothetical protein